MYTYMYVYIYTSPCLLALTCLEPLQVLLQEGRQPLRRGVRVVGVVPIFFGFGSVWLG